jgi:hypothetical protein
VQGTDNDANATINLHEDDSSRRMSGFVGLVHEDFVGLVPEDFA